MNNNIIELSCFHYSASKFFQLIASYLISSIDPHPLPVLSSPDIQAILSGNICLYFCMNHVICSLCVKFLVIQNQSWQLHQKILEGLGKNVGLPTH